ncbi:MAG: hypothetical protein IT317_11740 [Anaerolineales bacterium]|nr:hypothetical protein [Anaerolineales bacterium]
MLSRRRRPGLWAALAGAGLALAACGAAATRLPPLPPPTLARATPTDEMVVAVIGPGPTAHPTPQATPFALLLGEHLSAGGSFTQTETEAAGPMLCQIKRDSCAFSRLVADQNPDLLFSGGEPAPYDDEDHRMHPAMVMPLADLAARARAEWGEGVQIMVVEAYDSLLDHDNVQTNPALRYSLHFEGRSADLITWPADESRNGRLCILALEAGFTWVHQEGDHCHVSVQAESLCTACSPAGP